MASSAKFWNKIADRYAKRPVADEAVYEQKLSTTQGYFRPDWEVLEFGCGTGSTAIEHAPHVGHIRAIDISEKMIEIAKAKAAEAKIDNVAFEVAAIEDFDAPGESFDAVLGLSILHLLDDRDVAIAKAYQLLKPRGVFVSSTFCGGDSMRWLRFILPIGRFLGKMPYVDLFTREDLRKSMEAAGFVVDHEWQPGKTKAVFIVAAKN